MGAHPITCFRYHSSSSAFWKRDRIQNKTKQTKRNGPNYLISKTIYIYIYIRYVTISKSHGTVPRYEVHGMIFIAIIDKKRQMKGKKRKFFTF